MIYKREEYIEENPQDQKFPVKRIDVMAPVDEGRKMFIGQVVLGVQTPIGVQQIPISFEIQADSVQEAFRKFEQYAVPKLEESRRQLEDELRKVREEASSRIVRPGELNLRGTGNVVDFNRLKP